MTNLGSWPQPHPANTMAGTPFPDFSAASQAVLQMLQDRLQLGLWLVTRAVGPDQVVLAARSAAGSGYQVTAGTVLPWDGSLCSRMVAGEGPCVAPRVADVPAYADTAARLAHSHPADSPLAATIEAYIAVPLRHPSGQLFGTLCGFDPQPQPQSLRHTERFVLLQARLLATILTQELELEQQQRRAERAESDATRDALTGLANRRAWDAVLAAEQVRCRRYGHPATIMVVDLNDLKTINDGRGHAAGDQALRDVAQLLSQQARHTDLVARLGGDEFGVLAVETDRAGGEVTAARLRRNLRDAGHAAAVGLGAMPPGGSLTTAWHDADGAMYRDKHPAATATDHRSPDRP